MPRKTMLIIVCTCVCVREYIMYVCVSMWLCARGATLICKACASCVCMCVCVRERKRVCVCVCE